MSFNARALTSRLFVSPLVPETKWSARLTMLMVFLAPILPIILLKSMAPIFIAGAILITFAWMIENRRFLPVIPKALTYSLCAISIYGAISSLWSINPEESIEKFLKLLPFFIPLLTVYGAVQTFSKQDYNRIMLALSLGLLAGVGLYFVEYYDNNSIFYMIYDGDPKPKDVIQNKALYIFFLFLLPSALYCYKKSENKNFLLLGGILVISVPILIWISMNSSMRVISTLTGLGVIACFYLRTPLIKYAVSALVIITIFTAPFFAQSLRHVDGIMESDMSNALKSRIEIWDFAARRASEKPVFGWGLKSSPFIPPRGEFSVLYEIPEPIRHLHPHNGILQIWLELGLIGIVLLISLLYVIMRGIDRISQDDMKRFALLSFGIGFLYVLPSFGIWQTWFMATLALFAMTVLFCVRCFDNASRSDIYEDDVIEDEKPISY